MDVDESDEIEWLDPWKPLEPGFDPTPFLEELQRELAPGHPLANKTIIPRARRVDCDDWLVELRDIEPGWAVVPPPFPAAEKQQLISLGLYFSQLSGIGLRNACSLIMMGGLK